MNAAFTSWVCKPVCKTFESAMLSLNKGWQRYADSGELDDRALKFVDRASSDLKLASAALELAGLEICSAITSEVCEVLGALSKLSQPNGLAFEAISHSLVRLPVYLRLVANGAPDVPAALYDVLNNLRLVNGKVPVLIDSAHQKLKFDELDVRTGNQTPVEHGANLVEFITETLRPGLPSLLEDGDSYFVLDKFESKLRQMEGAAIPHRLAIYCWVLCGLVSNEKVSKEPTDLLSVLCLEHSIRVFDLLINDSPEAAEVLISDEMLGLIVQILEYSSTKTDVAASLLIRLGVSGTEAEKLEIEKVRNELAGASLSSVEDVYPLVLKELESAEELLNLAHTRGQVRRTIAERALEHIFSVASTLELLGDHELCQMMRPTARDFQESIDGTAEQVDRVIQPLIDAVFFCSKDLKSKIRGFSPDIFEDLAIESDTIHALLREARAELRTIRRKLTLHFETGEAYEELTNALQRLAAVSSGLTIVDLGNTSTALRHLVIYIHGTIRAQNQISEEALRLVARSLTATEMRLEHFNQGLVPPEGYSEIVDQALRELLGDQYTEAMPAIPEDLRSRFYDEEDASPSTADIHSLATYLLDVTKSWKGVPDSVWSGVKNLLLEANTLALLLEFKVVQRLTAELIALDSIFAEVKEWTPPKSEKAFDYVIEAFRVLEQLTGDTPHLPENKLHELSAAYRALQDVLIPAEEMKPAAKPQESQDKTASSFDEELLAVFSAEFEGLEKTLIDSRDDFYQAPESALPSTTVIHACHTLRGVSHTIERPVMGTLFGHWEELLKERQANGAALSDQEIKAFSETVSRTQKCAHGLRDNAQFDDSDGLVERVKTLLDSIECGPGPADVSTVVSEGESDSRETENAATASLLADIEHHDGSYDQEMLELYLEEADTELNRLEDLIERFDGDPNDAELLIEIKRLMHTLKGSSNMAGATTIGAITHELEDLIASYELGGIAASNLLPKLFAAALDDLRKLTAIARKLEALPTPEILIACARDALESGSLNEPMVMAALKESFELGKGGIALANGGSNANRDETTSPASTPEEQTPTTIESNKGDATKKGAPVKQEKSAPKVKKLSTPEFQVKEDEAFLESLERLRAIRHQQKETSRSAGATPPKVKVDVTLLDRLIDAASEANVDRDRIDHYRENMDRSEQGLRRLTRHLNTLGEALTNTLEQLQTYHIAHPEVFDPEYIDRISRLKVVAKDISDTTDAIGGLSDNVKQQTAVCHGTTRNLTRLTRIMREDLFNTRLVPIQNLSNALKTAALKTGDAVGKKVAFELIGEHTKIDRNLLDTLNTSRALEHLIRNSVDHGIEKPEIRARAGKPETGKITLRALQEGDQIVLRLCDDGAGIDSAKVRDKAVENGLIENGQALTDDEIIQLITSPGFSTATSVTQVSGRGVGMDVVKSTIEEIGGRLSISSKLGIGTEFILELPYTQGISRALVVEVGDLQFGIPTNLIRCFEYIESENLKSTDVILDGFKYPTVPLASICGLEEISEPFPATQRTGVVFIENGDSSFAILCSRIRGMQALHLKQTSYFKDTLRGVLGLAESIEGSLLTVIDPRELKTVMLTADDGRLFSKDRLTRPQPYRNRPLAFVVDDSSALRTSATRFLERMGYQVRTAVDGRDALTQIERCRPSLIVTDLEMPQIDGMELTRTLRERASLKGVPIIMVTSRSTPEIEKAAIEAGVDCFLPKPFNAELLKEAIDEVTLSEIRVG